MTHITTGQFHTGYQLATEKAEFLIGI